MVGVTITIAHIENNIIAQHFSNGQFNCNQNGFDVFDEIDLRFKDFKMASYQSYYKHFSNIEHEHCANVYSLFTFLHRTKIPTLNCY